MINRAIILTLLRHFLHPLNYMTSSSNLRRNITALFLLTLRLWHIYLRWAMPLAQRCWWWTICSSIGWFVCFFHCEDLLEEGLSAVWLQLLTLLNLNRLWFLRGWDGTRSKNLSVFVRCWLRASCGHDFEIRFVCNCHFANKCSLLVLPPAVVNHFLLHYGGCDRTTNWRSILFQHCMIASNRVWLPERWLIFDFNLSALRKNHIAWLYANIRRVLLTIFIIFLDLFCSLCMIYFVLESVFGTLYIRIGIWTEIASFVRLFLLLCRMCLSNWINTLLRLFRYCQVDRIRWIWRFVLLCFLFFIRCLQSLIDLLFSASSHNN